ncbi:MAG: DegT/DnrJ/EryC1/StrS family aminotransferase [Acidobacteriota bacterium]
MSAPVPLLDLRRQFASIGAEVERALRSVLESQRFILGKEVRALEKECAAFVGVGESIGVASGTDALFLSYRALGLEPDDEVITTPFTFFATASAILNAGARLVLADIEERTFNLDPEAAGSAISPRTRAVCVVHLFGQAASMEAFQRMSQKTDLALVEDACQSLGARAGGSMVGSLGRTGAFSFFPSKNLGGAGDGGLVTTGDTALAGRIRSLRHHGQTGPYEHAWIGTNSRLDEIQAAILRVKLKSLEQWNEARRRNARALNERFRASGLAVREDGGPLGGADLSLPVEAPGRRHVYNQYTLRARDRDGLVRHLKETGIGCAVYYPIPLHLQPCLAGLGYARGRFPRTEAASAEVVSLPVFPELKAEEIDRVAGAVRSYYKK